MVKILVLSSSYPTRENSHEGGFVGNLVKRLPERGIMPIVVAPHFPGGAFREFRDGIPVYRFPYFFPLRFERLAYGPGMLFNIRRDFFAFAGIIPFCKAEFFFSLAVIMREKVDCIHTHWLMPQGFVGALVHVLTGIPHVTTVHGSDLALVKKSVVLTRIGSFIIRHSDAVTVNSRYTLEQLNSLVPGSGRKARIIPMGVDPDEFALAAGSGKGYGKTAGTIILTVGRLIDWKGTMYLIDAMPEIIRHVPDARLVIIGTGPEEKSLRSRARSLVPEHRIEFLGAVSNADLSRYYHSADVFVLPSIEKNGNTEGLGVVLLEAMASGCPVVGTRVGGIPDIISDGENGFLVAEKDPVELADRIIRVITDSAVRQKFRMNGINRINQSFSWKPIVEQFVQVYHNVLEKST